MEIQSHIVICVTISPDWFDRDGGDANEIRLGDVFSWFGFGVYYQRN